MQLLKLTNVSVFYGRNQALNRINMNVEQGELVVLLGANGAGKSTIFRTISGLSTPASGKINFMDQQVGGWSPDQMVRAGVVQCAEGRKLFPQMSVNENLILGGYVQRKDKELMNRTIKEVFELFPILKEKESEPAGSLSGGQQQMLAIGRALMSQPKLLMLDEPSLGLAPLIVEQIFEIIQKINKDGTTILLAEQNASVALQIADRGYVIESGQIVMEGSSKELFNNEEIRKAYIGA